MLYNLHIFFLFEINMSMLLLEITKNKTTMDKINSVFFNAQKPDFQFLNFEFQPKLFVNVPNQTKVKGQLCY